MKSNLTITLIRYLKYCVVGGIGAIIDFSLYTVFIKFFQINYIFASIISISIALILVYVFQKNWTFQYKTKDRIKPFQRFALSVILTYLLNNAVLISLVELFRYDVIFAKIIQIILSTVWGYYLTNNFVFTQK